MEEAESDTLQLFNTAAEVIKQLESAMNKLKQREKRILGATMVADSTVKQQVQEQPLPQRQIPQQHQKQIQQQLHQQVQQQCKGDGNPSSCPCGKAASNNSKQQTPPPPPPLEPQQLQQHQIQPTQSQQRHQQTQQPAIKSELNYKNPQQAVKSEANLQSATKSYVNCSNYTECAAAAQKVCTEPSELRLILKLDTWIADNGFLVVRPRVYEDKSNTAGQQDSSSNNGTLAQSGVRVSHCSDSCANEDARPAAIPTNQIPQIQQMPLQMPQMQQMQQMQQSKQMLIGQSAARRQRSLSNIKDPMDSVNRHVQGSIHGGCQVNNHHDSVLDDQMSEDRSDGNSSVGSYQQHQLQPPETMASSTRELIERLHKLIQSDSRELYEQ